MTLRKSQFTSWTNLLSWREVRGEIMPIWGPLSLLIWLIIKNDQLCKGNYQTTMLLYIPLSGISNQEN